MGRLKEYLEMIKAGVENLPQVLEGVTNAVKQEFQGMPEDEQEEIIRRRLICSTCPFMSANAVKEGIYKTQRPDDHCIMCLCPIKTKTAALSTNCGIEKYNQRNPHQKMELKWTEYKK